MCNQINNTILKIMIMIIIDKSISGIIKSVFSLLFFTKICRQIVVLVQRILKHHPVRHQTTQAQNQIKIYYYYRYV